LLKKELTNTNDLVLFRINKNWSKILNKGSQIEARAAVWFINLPVAAGWMHRWTKPAT